MVRGEVRGGARPCSSSGAGWTMPIALEGSLKMKEVSYIHSEAYAAGELKHGTISLIEKGTLVISLATQPALYEKMISNMVEVKARGGYLMGLTSFGHYSMEDTADFTVYVPGTDEHFMASLAVVPLQLMGYYISVARAWTWTSAQPREKRHRRMTKGKAPAPSPTTFIFGKFPAYSAVSACFSAEYRYNKDRLYYEKECVTWRS